MMKKVIVMGSAFNPPHLGHAAMLKVALRDFPCHEVWVMPTGDRQDKKFSVRGEDRFQMAKLWIEELFPNAAVPIILSRMEMDSGKPTFTHETHQELLRIYPDHEFYFLFGGDILSEVRTKWHKGDEVFKNLNFLIVGRPGYDLPSDLPPHSTVLEASGNGISSTKVRAAIKAGEDVKEFIPRGVWNFIEQRKLYRD